MALLKVNFHSDVLGFNTNMVVVLPQNTENYIGDNDSSDLTKVKTLYLLHGMSDSETGWSRLTSIERYAREKGIAVVMAAANNSWYTNMASGFKYLDYFALELPKICRSFFPQLSSKKEDNFIAGNSMGGYGALKIALTYPEKFSCVGCFSGAFDIEKFITTRYKGLEDYWRGIFGDLDTIKDSINDVYHLAKENKDKANLLNIYMWCGEQDGLLSHNDRMYDLLKGLDYNVKYTHYEGTHTWKYWDKEVENFLEWIK